MASQSLLRWRGRRASLLTALDAEAVSAAGRVPFDPALAEAAVHSHLLHLAAQFQGFGRDLYSECVLVVMGAVPTALQRVMQVQFESRRGSAGGSGRWECIRTDFERFDLNLAAELAVRHPAAKQWVTALGHLYAWRNHVAHDNPTGPAHGGPLTLGAVRGWRTICDDFAGALDAVMYDHLTGAGRVAPVVTPGGGVMWGEVGEAFKVGDRVKLKSPSSERVGKVTEFRGRLGPGGQEVYRVKLRGGRFPSYIEVLPDQIELAPPKPASP